MSMATLLERLSRTTREKKQNAQDRFLQLVRAAANHNEFDIDEAADILEAADKTHEQLEDAIETQGARIGLAAQLKHKQALQKQMPKLEQAERIASENYERVVSEASSKLNEAKRAKRALESELLSLSYIEGKLSETCLDETLLAREVELTSKRMTLIQKRRPLDEDYRHSTALVSASHARIAGIESQIQKTSNNKLVQVEYRKDLARAQQALAHEINVEKQLSRAITEIDDQVEPLDRELVSIRLKKLEV
jgi:hypothetical protein